MFDVSWSELLVVGTVALIVVGPKELPALLRTVGRYVGMVKRQAAEFRTQFDDAMRESELDTLKKDVEGIGRELETSVREAEQSVQSEFNDARHALDTAAKGEPAAEPAIDAAAALTDADGLPIEPAQLAGPPVQMVAAKAAAAASEGSPTAKPNGAAVAQPAASPAPQPPSTGAPAA